jgi:septal ring factor EnvC (AmiA/AmiB activator)
VKQKTKVSTSSTIETTLEAKLAEVAELTEQLEATAVQEIDASNQSIADLESRIAAIQQRKMIAKGRIERAAQTRALFQPVPPVQTK